MAKNKPNPKLKELTEFEKHAQMHEMKLKDRKITKEDLEIKQMKQDYWIKLLSKGFGILIPVIFGIIGIVRYSYGLPISSISWINYIPKSLLGLL